MNMVVLAAALAATALTAPKGKVYNDEPVVTNVTFEGLATTAEVDAKVSDVAGTADMAWGAATTAGNQLSAHEGRADNPHGVTAVQVGAYTTEEADDKIAEATNGLLRTESDPTVSAWAKAAKKPTYTASEVGAYTKSETDAAISSATSGLASVSSVASVSSALAAKADAATVNSALTLKADKSALSGYATTAALAAKADKSAISAANPTFSNAVLSVGLNIDTNSVAVLNEIASAFGGFPVEGTATTVGGLLAALAAAIAWLKRNKADKTDVDALAAKVPKGYVVTILSVKNGEGVDRRTEVSLLDADGSTIATAKGGLSAQFSSLSCGPYDVQASKDARSAVVGCVGGVSSLAWKRAAGTYIYYSKVYVYMSNNPGTAVELVFGGSIQLSSDAIVVMVENQQCLSPDTTILMGDGTILPLSDIREGDVVACIDPHTGLLSKDEVVRVSSGTGTATDVWTFDDGSEVRTIGRHRFWNECLGEFMYLEAWNVGELAVRADGTTARLVSHTRIDGEAPHATLFTKKYNNYFAGGLLAGNRRSTRLERGNR